MSFLLSFFKKRPSAPVAYNRLQILLSHERASIENSADQLGLSAALLEQLQREILEVVKRHIAIEQDKIHIKHKHEAQGSILQVDLELPIATDSHSTTNNHRLSE